jgi:hypothetical protein
MQFPSLPNRRSGTMCYASVNVHHGIAHSRRDDLISWFYSLIELLNDGLPWSHLRKTRDLVSKKLGFSETSEFRALPLPLQGIWNYLEGMEINTWPNYDDIVNRLEHAFIDKEREKALPYEWEQLPEDVVRKFSMFSLAWQGDGKVRMFPLEPIVVEQVQTTGHLDDAEIDEQLLAERQRAMRVQGSEVCLLL